MAGACFGTKHTMDAVRLLVSWLWDDPYDNVTTDAVANALSSAREDDGDRVEAQKHLGTSYDSYQASKRQKLEHVT